MSSTSFQVRRATVDDLPALLALWRGMDFPVAGQGLEKRLTEFQVVVDDSGAVLAAVGLEMAERQGHIHHEAFSDFGLSGHLRPLLWDRLQTIATNHGLFRLWTREDAPFWKQTGLRPADPATREKLPAAWRADGEWLVLQMRAEAAIQAISEEKEFSHFMQAERARTQKTLDRARMLKQLATLAAIMLALFVLVLIAYVIRKDPTVLDQLRLR